MFRVVWNMRTFYGFMKIHTLNKKHKKQNLDSWYYVPNFEWFRLKDLLVLNPFKTNKQINLKHNQKTPLFFKT
jgi:hypothetical protein